MGMVVGRWRWERKGEVVSVASRRSWGEFVNRDGGRRLGDIYYLLFTRGLLLY